LKDISALAYFRLFDLVLSLLKEKGIKEEEIALGFIDEARPQNTANTVKV
jgi:hypothetical protein